MLIKEFKKSSKMDVTDDRKALAKLKQAAVDAKHILSSNANTTVAIESLFEGADFQMKLSRGKFDSTVASLYRKSAVPIEAALAATGLKKEDISSVLLAGGGSNAAKVTPNHRASRSAPPIMNDSSGRPTASPDFSALVVVR